MPSPYTVTVAKTATTAPGVADVITLTQTAQHVQIIGRDRTGTLEAWVTVDDGIGTPGVRAPAVAGDDVYWLDSKGTVNVETPQPGATVVRVLSNDAFPYYVAVY